MKKIFLTGSGGFIGRNLKESLAKKYNVFAPRSSELNLLDTQDVERYMKRHSFDCVVHAAAEVMARNYSKDVSTMLQNNLQMFFSITRNSRYTNRILYFGSGAEYDKSRDLHLVKETDFDEYVPADPYGFSKYVMSKCVVNDPKIISLKLFGCFGKYENWEVRFISNAICKALNNMDITIKKNVFFDYMYIGDLQRAVGLFIEKKNLSHQHYNLCTGKSIDLKSLAKLVQTVSQKDIAIKIMERGLAKEYSGSNARFMKEYNSFEFISHRKAIAELYSWYNANIQLINKRLLLTDK